MSEQTRTHRQDELDKAVRDLTRIGKIWAKHGLGVGRSALESSAETLRATASLLGRLAAGLPDDERGEAGEPERRDEGGGADAS